MLTTQRKMRQSQMVLGAVLLLGLLYAVSRTTGGGVSEVGSTTGPWSRTARSQAAGEYHIAIVADLDKKSKVAEERKPTFKSYLKEGVLRREGGEWRVEWTKDSTLQSKHNEAGRGMELSELVIFNNKLYTFDDRTGIVFEINEKRRAVPRSLLMEGDGETDKGQKTEWATVKDGLLYSGSFGKEYVGSQGEITSRNNLWVSTLSSSGEVKHEDWTAKYNKIRETTRSVHPAYLIIETMVWSPVKRRWYCLPRRVSQDPYDEEKDEKRGSNIVIHCNEDITSCEKFEVGTITPERGFSSAKFIPGTNDRLMVTLKSEEKESAGTQKTFISVIDIESRKVLLEESEVGDAKYEGIVFI